MRILIATPILFNPTSPFNHLLGDIIEAFVQEGHQIIRLVSVVNTADMGYKLNQTSASIKYRVFKRKEYTKSKILFRFFIDTITNIRQAIHFIFVKDVDILFEDVSYSSLWPILVAKLKKVKVVSMLQDIWPDNAVQSGLLKSSSAIYSGFSFIQNLVYKWSDRIVCISDDMKDFLISKGVPTNKIEVIYNWGYSDEPIRIKWEDNLFVKKYNLENNQFNVVYAGNIGKMQNVDILVDAAKLLEQRTDIRFLIIGDGSNRDNIHEKTKNLSNVVMYPFQNAELATHIYSFAGVNIIPLVKGGVKTALPSKTAIILSCGRPIIACVDLDSQYSKLIKNYSECSTVDSNDPEGLAREILRLSNIYDFDRTLKYSTKIFDKQINVNKYKNLIRDQNH